MPLLPIPLLKVLNVRPALYRAVLPSIGADFLVLTGVWTGCGRCGQGRAATSGSKAGPTGTASSHCRTQKSYDSQQCQRSSRGLPLQRPDRTADDGAPATVQFPGLVIDATFRMSACVWSLSECPQRGGDRGLESGSEPGCLHHDGPAGVGGGELVGLRRGPRYPDA